MKAWLSSVASTILQPYSAAPAVGGPGMEPFTYNVIVVDSDLGYNPCWPAAVPPPAGAWLSDDFGSPCLVVESGSR